MKIPLTMRYIEVVENSESNVMQIAKGPIPKLNSTDVLIRVAAAGVLQYRPQHYRKIFLLCGLMYFNWAIWVKMNLC